MTDKIDAILFLLVRTMTPLSNILSKRSETLSFSETLQRVEQQAHETITRAEQVSIPQPQTLVPSIELSQIRQALLDMREQIDMMVSALGDTTPAAVAPIEAIPAPPPTPRFVYTPKQHVQATELVSAPEPERKLSKPQFINNQQIIQGRFNGQQMIDGNNNVYEVPANYASKSKMVEGDVLKLTITQDGRHFYKQIGPIKRARVVGELSQDPQGNWVVIADMTPYRILTASVTFHRARQGDQVVILVPEGMKASWGAVETFMT